MKVNKLQVVVKVKFRLRFCFSLVHITQTRAFAFYMDSRVFIFKDNQIHWPCWLLVGRSARISTFEFIQCVYESVMNQTCLFTFNYRLDCICFIILKLPQCEHMTYENKESSIDSWAWEMPSLYCSSEIRFFVSAWTWRRRWLKITNYAVFCSPNCVFYFCSSKESA